MSRKTKSWTIESRKRRPQNCRSGARRLGRCGIGPAATAESMRAASRAARFRWLPPAGCCDDFEMASDDPQPEAGPAAGSDFTATADERLAGAPPARRAVVARALRTCRARRPAGACRAHRRLSREGPRDTDPNGLQRGDADRDRRREAAGAAQAAAATASAAASTTREEAAAAAQGGPQPGLFRAAQGESGDAEDRQVAGQDERAEGGAAAAGGHAQSDARRRTAQGGRAAGRHQGGDRRQGGGQVEARRRSARQGEPEKRQAADAEPSRRRPRRRRRSPRPIRRRRSCSPASRDPTRCRR